LQENEDVVEKIKCIVCKMYVYKKISRKDMGLAVDSGFHSKRLHYRTITLKINEFLLFSCSQKV